MLTILWIKDVPELKVDTDEVMCSFADQYVKCDFPDGEELGQLVSGFQNHRHSTTCRRLSTTYVIAICSAQSMCSTEL